MAYNFTDFVKMLDRIGIIDVLLPFIFIFTLIYAALQRTHILGKDKKIYNATVALIISLMVIIPHIMGRYPASRDPVLILALAIPRVAILLVAGLGFFVLAGLGGIKPENYREASYSLITIILVNIFVSNAYPSIANFILIVSAFLIAINIIIGGRGVFGMVPIIGGTLILMIFHWAITGWTKKSLPYWLLWLENPTFQTFVVASLTFLTVIMFVMKREK